MTNKHHGKQQRDHKSSNGRKKLTIRPSDKKSSGGIKKHKGNDRHQKKSDIRKAKAHAPSAEELDSELAKYMGEEYVSKKLDEQLDAYFKADEASENQ